MSATTATVDPLTSAGVPTGTPTHPTYAVLAPIWRKLLHVYHGSGGFRDGTYLVPHPREWEDWSGACVKPTKKLFARRALARYENVAATILNQKQSAIFRETITRTIGGKARKDADHPLRAFWDNVDGQRTGIDDWMKEAWIPSAIFGSALHVMDRPVGPTPFTKADEGAPYLRLYSPLDMPDWLTNDRGKLIAVKLLEAVERTSLKEAAPPSANYRERCIDAVQWEVTRQAGVAGSGDRGDHRFGRLPVVVHYSNRLALSPVAGQSVLNDPQLFIDLYNLTSEIREILRSQTFGLLNIELGTGENATPIEKALAMLGQEKGVENIIFSPGEGRYLQPDTSNVEVYQKERTELMRAIYRLCAVPWESDSKDAEAEGSMKLKREDMNQVLAGYADECQKAEYEIVELWFRAQHGDNWERELKKAEVVIQYPDTFDVTPFDAILEQAQAAITLEMPPEFMATLKKRLVPKWLPDATPEQVAKIEADIDRMVKELAAHDKKTREAELRSMTQPEGIAA